MASAPVTIQPPTVTGTPLLVSPDGTQTREIRLSNDGRAYMTGNSVTERVMGSRVGQLPFVYTDRVAGVSYQVSASRPARVTVMVSLSCPLGESVSAALLVGDDDASLVEQDRESVAYTGLVSQVLGVTPTLTFNNTRTTKLNGDLAPGQWYRISTAKSGVASVTISSVKERVF